MRLEGLHRRVALHQRLHGIGDLCHVERGGAERAEALRLTFPVKDEDTEADHPDQAEKE